MRAIILTLLVLLLAAMVACADGGFIGPRMAGRSGEIGGVSSPGQKGIIIDGGDGTELLILQTTYRGPATDFAWIVPVPGLPPQGGVFAPDPYFIEMVFDLTQVHTVTDVRVQTGQSGMMFAGVPLREDAANAGSGRVTVHRRMTAGDYDAAVLSASDERALLAWLTAEGYTVAEPAEAAFAHYIGRGWQFVALKVRPEIARERPLLADVQPIAIRFPTDRLTFPLHISRISAPVRTSLSLIVLAESAVGCEQIGWADIAESRPIPTGSSWATIRLGTVGAGEPAICCERLAELPIPADLAMLVGRWAPDEESDRTLTATRMFTIVGPQQMEDLTFAAALAPRSYPIVHRSATVRDIFARSPWAVLLAGALFLLVIGLSRGAWRQEAVRLMAVLGVVLAIWGVAVPTLLILLVALPVLLLTVEREVGRDGVPEGSLMPNRELIAGIALLMLSVPLGLTLSRPLAGLMVVGALVLLVREGFRAVSPTAQPAPPDPQGREPAPRPPLALAAFVATGWAAVLIEAGTSDPAPAFVVADGAAARAYWALTTVVPAQILVFGLEALWILATLVFLRGQLRTWPDRQPGLLLRLSASVALLYLMTMGFGLSMPGVFMGMPPQGWAALLHVAALAMGIAILCFTVIAPFASAQSRRIAPGFATVAALMGLLVMAGGMRLMGPAEAGSGSAEAREIEARMDQALKALDDALAEFADDTGAFPVQLADLLAAEPPAWGLDGSGNRVAIEGGAQGPWLLDMPIDPITRRRDTWLYEVTGDPMVSSGAYAIEVEWTAEAPTGANLRRWAIFRSREEPDFPARIMEGLGLRLQPQVR